MRSIYVQTVLMLCMAGGLWGQRSVDYFHHGERVAAVVPMTGSGRDDDPKRPLFAPVFRLAGGRAADPRTIAITGFRYQLSDDGKFALVEFVARNRKDLLHIINHGRADVKAFEKSKPNSKRDIETEFKKHKKDFDYDKFFVRPSDSFARPANPPFPVRPVTPGQGGAR